MIEGDINERMAQFAPSQNPRAYQFTRDQLQSGEAFETLRQDPQYRESFQRWEEEQRRSDVPVGIPLDTITIDTDVAPEPATDDLANAIVAHQRMQRQEPPMPAAPAAGEEQAIDPIAARIVEQQKQALDANVLGARSVNPDEAAKALRLGNEIGIGQQAAFADMSRAEQQAYLMRLRKKDYTRTDPVLANFLANRRFAEMAHDDLGVIGTLHGIALDFAYLYNEGVTPSMRRGFRVGELQVEMGRAQDIAGVRAQWAPRSRLASEIAKELKELGPPEGILGTTAYVVGQQLAGLPEVLETTVMGATLGGGAGLVGGPLAPATVPAGIVLGGGAGMRTGMARVSFMASAGLSYQNMIEKGYDPDTAYRAAIGIGLMNASLDMVSLEMVGSGVRRLGVNVFQQEAAKALARPGAVQAFKTFGTEYLKVVGTEGATEFTQGFLEQVIDDVARVHSGMGSVIMDDGGIRQLLAQSWEEGMMGVMGSSILGGIAPGGNLYFDMRRAAESYRAQNVFTALETARTESRLAARSPDVYERHLDAQMSGVGMGTLYIDGQVARQILAQSGLTAQQLEQAIPGIGAQLEEVAADQRMDVEIPTARYGTALTNTDLGRAMKPHLRGKAEGMSFVEAERFNASKQEVVREAEQILAQKQEADGAFVAEARDIYNDVRRQAMEAGQDSDVADVAASLYQAFVVTQAAEQNMTPAQFQAAQGVRGIQGIMGEMAPMAAAPTPRMEIAPGVMAPARPAGMTSAAYERLILGEFEAPAIPSAEVATIQTQTDAASTSIDQSSIPAKAKSGLGISVKQIGTALRQGNAVELANALWKLRERMSKLETVPAELQALAASIEERLASLGITIEVPQIGAEDRGGQEVERVSVMPNKDSAQVFDRIKTVMAPVVRRNGAVISRGQVVVEAGSEAFEAQRAAALDVETQRVDAEINERMARIRQAAAAPGVMEQAAVQRSEPATLERLQMQAQRGVRKQARKVELSPAEEKAIETAASDFGESAAEIREAVLNHKKAHPTTQGWAPLEFVKLAPKKIEDKGKKGLGLEKLDLQYQEIPYGFHRDASGAPLQPNTPEYQGAVTSVARRMVDEVRAVARRAAAGDLNAVRIINQSTWYKAMRTALRREFGGLGDLFADLLGATSPNTPVRGNWDFALDVLRRAVRGDFDQLITKWETWVETIERLETDVRAYINDEKRAMEARGEKVTQAAIQRKPEYIEKFKALKEARELPDELLPRQENGKKYGFNGGNVVRAMVGLWRTVREQNTLLGTRAQAPKALNFSGNLIGFRSRATIDVWAARMLQRLAALLRIPSMAETGVAGDMLPDGSTTGQFGFGQDVFAEAAQRIRNDSELNQNAQLAQLNDDDLQALVWFIEKELWTINNWTSVAGEGGSFELEASLAGISDREMVTKLRKTIDAGVPTKIRQAANQLPAAQQAKLNWYLDPAKAGWRQRIEALRAERDAIPTTLTKKAQRELRTAISKRLDAALKKSGFAKLEQALEDAIAADMKVAAIEEARKAAQAQLIAMERRVDRYTAGLSQQQSLDSQGVDYVPTDADQARLADSVRLRGYRADRGELLVAIKSMPTEGRYGSIERSIDLEVIARQGWSPDELWKVILEEARDGRQESTFLSRVLRADEAIDPTRHRPGLEIYFRSPVPRDKLDALVEKLNANGVDFFTVIVDARRSTEAQSGAMADAVGIRMQYIPEFMQRYGIEDFTGLSEAEIADRVRAKEAEWLLLADQVRRVMPEVSFAGVFWHETRVAFADAYESEINAITTGTATGDGGLPAKAQWAGQSVSEGLAAANRFVESRAAQAEPDGGGQVLGGVQEGDRVGFAQPGVGTVFEQAAAAPGPRGGIDIRRMVIMLTKASDRTTLWHEFVHFFLHMYTEAAVSGRASERQLNDLDLLLKWFKIDGETPAERLAKWSAMTLDQKRKHHEALTYNAEIYAFEGKAPSAELIPVFERLRAFMLRVYKSIRDDLNAIYRREFGEDLPILTGEVRQVMDRMLATDEQIRRQAAINEMKPAFETQEQSKMNDAEWAAYKAMEQEAIEASITDMNKASLRQMQWLSNARSRIVRDMQRKHDRQRKEVSAEVAAAVRVEPVYRAMTYLRTGKFIDADGTEIAVEGPHRLDIKRIKEIYETVPTAESLEPLRATGMPVPTVVQPDLAKLGTGSYGMMGLDGLDPDLVAETFGYSSGDELIRALVAAKPMKEEVAARTDAEMLRRFGDMNTQEAVEAEVQKSLHNEARARMLAVELRWRTKATQPVRVMLEAAKQVARDLIAGKRIRDVRPSDFVAAEARASRDIQRLQNLPDPGAIGMAAQTRAMNDRLAKGMDNATAMAEAIVEGARAAQAAEERNAALKAQYGADPQQALIRASRAQLYQNQLAAEALRVQDEVAKDIKYLRRVLRDENVKRMGAPAADQIAGLLERYEVAPVSLKRLDERRALTEWLAQQAELGLVPDIAPEIVNEARRVNYREVKVSEFRDLVDAIRQIEHIGKRERNAAQEKLRAKFDALKDEAIQSMKDVAAKRGRKARKELGDEDRKWSQLIAGYDAMQQTIGSIVYVLDGGQRDGPLARMLLFTANDAGNQETTDRADATLALSKILDPIERKGQFSGRKLYFPQIDDSLSLEQRMVVALNYGNQSNIDRLLNGEKWTEEQVQPILESLTEEQLNAVQAIWNYVESFKPRVAAQERNLLGREPNWIEPRPFTVRSADGKIVNMAGGYYPAKYNPRRSSMSREMDESVEADRQMREAITAATTTRSYTKNRSDKPPEGGVLSRQMGGLYAGVNEVIHDLAWRTWAMDANRLLRDKEFQTVINSIYGRETYSAIKNWVDATVRGERGNYDVIENIAIGVRRNVSVSAMALKFITAAIQVTGLIPATVRTGITPMVRSVAHFAANPRESSRIAREKSSFMRNRGRTRYRDLNEIANIVRGESRARRSYLANAYVLIGLQQGMVDMSVWWAAYSKAIKEGKAEEMAVSIADQTVIDTQGSGMLKDLSQAMRGGQKQSAYAKLFTSFYQFSNTQYALLSAQLRTAPSMGKAAADAFMILVVGAFIEEMLRTLLKPSPDDEEPEDLAKALIANQIDFVIGLPFGGGELRGIGDMIVGEQAMQYRGPSGLRMVGEVRTFAGQTVQGEFDRAWTRSAINMSGLIWGIPSAQINDTIDGINAAVEGEVEGAEAVLAPITGVRR